MYQCLKIDKIKFSFAEKNKPKEGIDCYMDAEDFVADFIPLITAQKGTLSDCNLVERIMVEKKRMASENAQFGNNVWESRPGKGQNDTLKQFGIQPGNKTQMVFKATESSEEKGSKPKQIIVGFDFKELKLLALRWSFLYEDYKKVLAERYSMQNMTSNFTKRQNQSNEGKKEETPTSSSQSNVRVFSVSSDSNKNKKQNEKPAPAQPDKKPETTDGENQEMRTIKVKVLHGLVDLSSGNKAMQVITEDSCTLSVICQKDFIASVGTWDEFSKKCREGAIINVTGQLYGDRFILRSVA